VASADEGRDDERDLLALPVHDGLDVVEQPAGDLVRLGMRLDCQRGLLLKSDCPERSLTG
jgi:hypothetical protein